MTAPLSDDVALFGMAVQRGANIAVKEINEAGGINGVELLLTVYDDKNKAENVVELYEKLVDEGMQISLGSVTSSCCKVFAENAQKDGMFVLTPSATNLDVFEYDRLYGMDIAYMEEMDILIDYLHSLDIGKSVPIIYNGDYPYAVERKDYLLEKAPDLFKNDLVIDDEFYWDEMEWDLLDPFLEYDNLVVLDYLDNTSLDMIAGDIEFLSDEDKNFIGVCTDYDFKWGKVIDQGATVLLPFDINERKGDYAEFFDKYYDIGYDNALVALGYDAVYAIYEALLLAIENGGEISPEMTAAEFGEILDGIFADGFEFDALTGGEGDGRGMVTWNADGRVKKKLVPVKFEYDL
ncbi:MAG: hypothetical protein E7642_03580 [Ruminococcaceae bacterium]|nr:hypothetical protein [Oscillospiraceae bacterium]